MFKSICGTFIENAMYHFFIESAEFSRRGDENILMCVLSCVCITMHVPVCPCACRRSVQI